MKHARACLSNVCHVRGNHVAWLIACVDSWKKVPAHKLLRSVCHQTAPPKTGFSKILRWTPWLLPYRTTAITQPPPPPYHYRPYKSTRSTTTMVANCVITVDQTCTCLTVLFPKKCPAAVYTFRTFSTTGLSKFVLFPLVKNCVQIHWQRGKWKWMFFARF